MAFSSVSVVTSSLALKWWTRPLSSVMPGEEISKVTMVDSLRTSVSDTFGGIFDIFRTRRAFGYSQLPVEMSEV